jgi:1-acyl-sn-glycerol-3-phosphate acyltransferase
VTPDKGRTKDRGYWVMRKVFVILYRILADIESVGLENFNVDGPCLFVGNHLSVFDPPLMMILLPKRAQGFAADKYRRHLIFSPFLRFIGVIFIRRGEVDRLALRAGLKVLREGGWLGLAPEGTRSETGQLQQAKDGAAYLASRTDATIVPVGITGTEKMMGALKRGRRAQVRVVVGKPFKLPHTDSPARGPKLAAYTDLIMCRVAALLPESYRGYYHHRCTPDGVPLPMKD